MTDRETIETLTTLLKKHGIAEMEYQDETTRLHVSAQGTITSPAQPKAEPAPRTIAAPHAGVLRLTGGSLPRRVAAHEILALLQAGPLLRPVTAPVDGVIDKALAEDGALVGYGAPLFSFHDAG